MPQLLIKLWLNAKISVRNNTNPVKDKGKLIYSIAGEEIPRLFLTDSNTECDIPGIQELKHMQTLK